MKRIMATALAAVFVLVAGVGPAEARSSARLRWEGAAITLGALGFLAVLNEAVRAQDVRVRVEAPPPEPWGYDEYPPEGFADDNVQDYPYDRPLLPEAQRYEEEPPPPPPPAPGRVWVPGHWFETEVWVPLSWREVWVWDGERRDRRDLRRRPDRYDRRERYDYRGGRYERRPSGGHFERRRVWRDGYYR